ncbi:MAG: hypothetical protein UF068_06615 [Slackia isoflavoniconvertens]|nr:hypothetical protein [Slackia isoflavoniconvertens]
MVNGYLAELVSLEFMSRFSENVPTVKLGQVLSISTKSLKPQDCFGEVWEHYSIPAYDEKHWPVFEPADGIKSNKYIVDKDCILISKLNPTTKRIWMPACSSNRPVCSTEFIVYKPNEPKHKSFYYAAIDAPAFTDFLLAHVTGSTGSRQRTQPKATLVYPMPAPGTEAIEDFCAFADPIYEQIKANELESKQLEELRDVLLPRLMSGKIDVSKVDLTQLNSQFPKAWLSRCLPRCWDWICHPELAMRVVAPVFVGGVKRSNFIVASADVLMDMGVNLQHVVLGIHALLVGGVNGIHLCENRI